MTSTCATASTWRAGGSRTPRSPRRSTHHTCRQQTLCNSAHVLRATHLERLQARAARAGDVLSYIVEEHEPRRRHADRCREAREGVRLGLARAELARRECPAEMSEQRPKARREMRDMRRIGVGKHVERQAFG